MSSPSPPVPGTERTLKRDFSVLREFHSSSDPNMLVLYHHIRDRAYDAFNAQEYNAQMLKYYANGFTAVEVVPRSVGGLEYVLVSLRHSVESSNSLCELAYLVQRQFAGISMLAKKRCFACHKPTAKRCSQCQCAMFCSAECLRASWGEHKALCKAVKKAGAPRVAGDDENLEIAL
jgi:hypothetical protein